MNKISSITIFIFFFTISNAQSLQWDWVKTNPINSTSFSSKSVVDSQGNLYVCGSFGTPTFTFDSYVLNNTANSGTSDRQWFIAKYDSSGLILWARTFVHSGYVYIRSMKTDVNDNLVILGDFNDSLMFDDTLINNSSGGGTSIFITKFSTSGNVNWAIGVGNESGLFNFSLPFDLSIDQSGNIYVSGRFGDADFRIDSNITLESSGNNNIFLIKYNENGIAQWAKKGYIYTNGSWAHDNWLSVDSDGNVYLTGSFVEVITFDEISIATPTSSSTYLAKFNSLGQVQYLKKFGNSGYQSPNEIEIDSNNNVYLIGEYYFGSATFGSTTLTNSGYSDVFITKLTPNGNVVWAKKCGGIYNDFALGIAINLNNVYVTGEFNSPTMTINAINLINNIPTSPINSENGFIAKYDLDGNFIAASAPQNTGTNSLNSVSVYDNYIYCSGYFNNSMTLGTTTLSTTTGDFFVAKLNPQTLDLVNHNKSNITIYPNPVKNLLNINFLDNISHQFKITDLMGRQVLRGEISNKIDVTVLPTGIYVLSIEYEKIKFIKE